MANFESRPMVKGKTPFAIRALLFDYLSLACIAWINIALYISEIIFVLNLLVMAPIGVILSTIGIIMGILGARNQEKYAFTSIVFGVLNLLVIIGLMVLFSSWDTTGWTG